MRNLQIIQASAGAGKTFTLTREIIKLVISEPVDYFKKILAVTFTNKATAEMKERILKELYVLSSGKKSDYMPDLIKTFPHKPEKNIREKARAVLLQILHNYSWFRVETIDSFFQGIIRSFIHEIGVPGNYNIEIDQDKVLDEAVDSFLGKLGQDKMILNWLLDYIEQKISEGKSWTVKSELLELGRHLFKEKIITHSEILNDFLDNKDNLINFRVRLNRIISSFESFIQDNAAKGHKILTDNGFLENDTFQGNRGPYSFFSKNALGQLTFPNSYTLKVLDIPDKWPSGKCSRKEELKSLGAARLNPLLSDIIEHIDINLENYNSAKISLKNFHLLGLLNNLQQEINDLKKDKSIMLISDAAPFIHKIIDGNDIPFIYEKAGNQINHLLIDEFQDTSDLQWENFKPLISNSLSEDNKCLIVGDVKQSIYRWRNSKWEILAHQVYKDFSENNIVNQNLDTNWRSSSNIIGFNNLFFKSASHIIQPLVQGTIHKYIPIEKLYSSVVQNIPAHRASNSGLVSFTFYNEEEIKGIENYYSEELIKHINELLSFKYQPGDITILVRTKTEGSEIADFLVRASKDDKFIQEVGVISNESLFLISSPVIRLLISALQYVYKPNEKLIAAELVSAYLRLTGTDHDVFSFPSQQFNIDMVDDWLGDGFSQYCKNIRLGGLYNITEQLIERLKLHRKESDLVYLHSFLDVVFDYSSKEIAELSGFLKYWEEEGTRKTISAAETSGSIKIMTIHKSKGLEFPVVIIPFANWEYKPKTNETLWIAPDIKPYSSVPLIPVNFNKTLAESLFNAEYYTENYLSLVDNINLLYVAFTRAEKTLICMAKKSKDAIKHTGDIIYNILEDTATKKEIELIKDGDHFYFGELISPQQKTKDFKEKILKISKQANHFPKVSFSSQAKEYMRCQDEKEDAAARGRILHGVMEKIKVANDLEPAINQMVLSGIISHIEKGEIYREISLALSDKRVYDWFSGEYEILNETSIISTNSPIKRPDRVMIKDNRAIIVDYKFGTEENKQKHEKQVADYMQMIRKMGYANLKGYLWYVLENDIVEVKI